MADNMNWRYGDTEPVVSAPIASANVIEIGDLVAATDDPATIAAGDMPWNTDLATTQMDFAGFFLGVAAQRSRDGDTDGIRCNTRGVHEFDCDAATFILGETVAPAQVSGQNKLENKKVVSLGGVTTAAIGRVAKQYDTPTTKVLVEITSAVMHGGVQALS